MAGASPIGQLADLAARYWRFQCAEFPLDAILAGESTPDAVLFREAPSDYERRYAEAGRLLAELQAIPRDSLTGQDWATCRLLQGELEEIQ